MSLVQRLREDCLNPRLSGEAADEIERLSNFQASSGGEKPATPAFDELEALLGKYGHQCERIVVVDINLWFRLADEARGPLDEDRKPALWYKNRTMILPSAGVLVCTKEFVQ